MLSTAPRNQRVVAAWKAACMATVLRPHLSFDDRSVVQIYRGPLAVDVVFKKYFQNSCIFHEGDLWQAGIVLKGMSPEVASFQRTRELSLVHKASWGHDDRIPTIL